MVQGGHCHCATKYVTCPLSGPRYELPSLTVQRMRSFICGCKFPKLPHGRLIKATDTKNRFCLLGGTYKWKKESFAAITCFVIPWINHILNMLDGLFFCFSVGVIKHGISPRTFPRLPQPLPSFIAWEFGRRSEKGGTLCTKRVPGAHKVVLWQDGETKSLFWHGSRRF